MSAVPDRYALLKSLHFDQQPQEERPVNASDENKVILTGTVRDLELKTTRNNKSFAVVLVEARRTWTDRAGNVGERTAVIEVTSWGTRMLPAKGDRVRVEGRLDSRAWADRSGVERLSLNLTAESIVPVGDGQESSPARQPAEQPQASPTPGAPLDDDLPF